jgi:hypothetical protein
VVKELRDQEDHDEFENYAGGFIARKDIESNIRMNTSHNDGRGGYH